MLTSWKNTNNVISQFSQNTLNIQHFRNVMCPAKFLFTCHFLGTVTKDTTQNNFDKIVISTANHHRRIRRLSSRVFVPRWRLWTREITQGISPRGSAHLLWWKHHLANRLSERLSITLIRWTLVCRNVSPGLHQGNFSAQGKTRNAKIHSEFVIFVQSVCCIKPWNAISPSLESESMAFHHTLLWGRLHTSYIKITMIDGSS